MGLFDKRSKLEKLCEKQSKNCLSFLSSILGLLGSFKTLGTAEKADELRLRYCYMKSPHFLRANALCVLVDKEMMREAKKVYFLLDPTKIKEENPEAKAAAEHFINIVLPKYELDRIEALKGSIEDVLKRVEAEGL